MAIDKFKVAEILFNLECLKISLNPPFTYSSGLKGPIYCDNRKIVSHVPERELLLSQMKDLLLAHAPKFSALAAVATAGIAPAAILAHLLSVPVCYVRGQNKGYGLGKQVEGDLLPGSPVVVVEDLVNQANGLELAVEALRREGFLPTAAVCYVDYQTPKSRERLEKLGIPLYALTDFLSIVSVAQQKGLILSDQKNTILAWHSNPEGWSTSL